MIPEEIKQKYPFEEEYKILEDFINEYKKRNIKIIINHPVKGKRMLGHSAIIYLARISYKSNFLFSGFINSISIKNTAVLLLILRAHIETTASLGYFLYNLKKFYNGEISLNDIDLLLYRLSTGYKDPYYRKEKPAIPESINVLTMIDATDKLLQPIINGATKDDKPFSKIYTELSEICHLNSLGLIFGTFAVKPNEAFFSNTPSLGTKDQSYFLIEKIILSCNLYFDFYEECRRILKDNEHMPRIKYFQ
jgi:phosphate starvation-inducible membrane PsiE